MLANETIDGIIKERDYLSDTTYILASKIKELEGQIILMKDPTLYNLHLEQINKILLERASSAESLLLTLLNLKEN